MADPASSTRARRSEQGRRSPSRTVRIIAYLLASALFLSIPIILFLLYAQIQGARRADYEKYASLVEADMSREGGHLRPDMDVLAYGERRNRPVRWITNSKGFRNASEFTHEVPDDTFRILFMGDSYVDGFRTDQERTIGSGLERNLANAACKQGFRSFQVMLSGHNNPAAALYNYQEHGRKYDPRLVILGISVGNDITPRDYKKSLWPDHGDSDAGTFKLVVSDRPAEQNDWQDLYLPDDAYTPKRPIRDHLLKTEKNIRDDLAEMVPGLGHMVPPVIGPPPDKRFRVHAGGNLTSLGLFYDPLLPEVEEWFRDLDEIILAMNGQVASNGGRLLVVIFPTRVQVDARDWRLLERFYSLDATRFRLDYPGTRIRQLCRTHEIDCLDLLPGFSERIQQDGTRLYMERGDMHFNVDGQALAAELIANHICSASDAMRTQ